MLQPTGFLTSNASLNKKHTMQYYISPWFKIINASNWQIVSTATDGNNYTRVTKLAV
jgi:hypothetical protein